MSIATQLVLPNLVIAGCSKAGTTSLFRYLAQHPQVCASDVKEVRYFFPLRFGEPTPTLEQYSRHFAHHRGEPIVMEATPGYVFGGETIATAIDRTLPDARVLVLLRDPVERFLSYHAFVRSRVRIPRSMDVEAYLDACLWHRARGIDGDREHLAYWGLSSGRYVDFLAPWFRTFGPRLRILFFEDLASDAAGTVARTCGWLGVDAAPVSGFDLSVENRTVGYRNPALQRAALGVNRAGRRFFGRHRGLKRGLRHVYHRVNGEAPHGERATSAQRARLRELYADANRELAALLIAEGVSPLPSWLRGTAG